jgi:TonB family protein
MHVNKWGALALAVAFAASAVEPPAESMTWQEANKRSAALVKDHRTIEQGADLARLAFDLYPQQTKSYLAANHAQLLLNVVDARWKATGSEAARGELERGIASVMQKAESNDPVFVDLWRQGAAISAEGSRENDRYNDKALAAAEQAWGTDDPRTIKLLLNVLHDRRKQHGFDWARSRFVSARERALKNGEENALVAEIDFVLAKLDFEVGKKDTAIEKLQALVARLEPRTDLEQETTLQMAYSLLELVLEDRGKLVSAAEIRKRREERAERPRPVDLSASAALPPDELYPTARVPPQYPERAARRRVEGVVELQVRVNPDGTVADATVIRSEPPGLFDEASLRAIRKWKFKPKIVDGKAVEATGVQRITFELR